VKYADRIRETTTTTGTGTLNLSGAVSGFVSFVAGVGTGSVVYYLVQHRDPDFPEWEIGVGTVTDATTDTLSRSRIVASSNSGNAVNFTAGTKDVRLVNPALAIDGANQILTAVRVATTTSGTLASSFENGDTVDGVTLATGDRILIKNQGTASENGVYVVAVSGAPSRASDMFTGTLANGVVIPVLAGTVNGGRLFACTNAASSATVGTSSLTFVATAAPVTHATQHQHGGADEVATATAAANAIPKAGSDGKLDGGWIDPADVEAHYNTQVAQVSGGEITAGTETSIRRFSPADIVSLIAAHESGGGGGSELTYVLRNTGTSYSVAANTDLFVANASNFTVTFDGSPTDGDRVRVTKLLVNTNWVALDLNGQTLGNGTTSIIYLRRYGATADLVFRNGGWNYLVNGTGVKATSTELTAGTETEIRSYSPADLKSIISTNGGLLSTTVKTSAYTAAAGELVLVDPSAASADIAITLPATAANCAVMLVTSAAGPWNVTIGRNGNTVNGLTDTTRFSMRYEGQLAQFRPDSSGYIGQVVNPPNAFPAYDFDGSTYYSIANSSAINITGALTISCWLYAQGTGSQIVYGGYDSSSPFAGYGLSVGGSGGADRIEFWDGSSWRAGSRAVRHRWTHVAAVHNGTNSVSIYIDGRRDATVAANALSSYTGTKALGASSDGASDFNGLLQDFRIYSSALTAANIRAIFNNRRGWPLNDFSNLVAWYLGNEDSGSTTVDRVSANNGTVSGTAAWGPGFIRL